MSNVVSPIPIILTYETLFEVLLFMSPRINVLAHAHTSEKNTGSLSRLWEPD